MQEIHDSPAVKTRKLRSPAARLLADQDSLTTPLITLLIDHYGGELLSWHPLTIDLEVKDDFGVLLPRRNLDKIMAGICLLTSDDFYRRLPRFIQLCNILSGDIFEPGLFDWADSYECAWGITEAALLSPPEEKDPEPFDEEILAYLGFALRQDGISRPPDVLQIAKLDYDAEAGLAELTDDPVLYESAWQLQDAKSQEIRDMLSRMLRLLASQLESLELLNGTPKDVIEKIRASVSTR